MGFLQNRKKLRNFSLRRENNHVPSFFLLFRKGPNIEFGQLVKLALEKKTPFSRGEAATSETGWSGT